MLLAVPLIPSSSGPDKAVWFHSPNGQVACRSIATIVLERQDRRTKISIDTKVQWTPACREARLG